MYLTIVFTFFHFFRRILVEERTERVEETRGVVCGEFCTYIAMYVARSVCQLLRCMHSLFLLCM